MDVRISQRAQWSEPVHYRQRPQHAPGSAGRREAPLLSIGLRGCALHAAALERRPRNRAAGIDRWRGAAGGKRLLMRLLIASSSVLSIQRAEGKPYQRWEGERCNKDWIINAFTNTSYRSCSPVRLPGTGSRGHLNSVLTRVF